MAERPPLWIFVAVALAIALAAFGLDRLVEGAGMIFMIGATVTWVAVAQKRWGNKVSG